MAIYWTAKPDDAIYRYTWSPALAEGDELSSHAVLSETGASLDQGEISGGSIVFFVSGGVAGTPAVFSVVAYTADGEEITETIRLPIVDGSTFRSKTARDVCDFAMRKVVGNGESMDAEELADTLERLNDMIALWRIDGLDIGVGTLVANDALDIPDEYVTALKFNLRVSCHDHYEQPVTPYDANMAEMSMRLVANRLFQPADLTMPPTLRISRESVSDLF